MNVVSYLRVSTTKQLDGDGFERQARAVAKFCFEKGWTIVKQLSEQQTGSDGWRDREKLSEALATCQAGGAQAIVVERVDRIGRDLIVCEVFFNECKKLGISVFAADSGQDIIDAEADPTRKLVRQVLGSLAEWGKAELVHKLQSGRRRKAAITGKPCGGRKNLPLNSGTHKALQIARESRAMGASWTEVCNRLNQTNIRTPAGSDYWTRGAVERFVKKYDRLDGNKLPTGGIGATSPGPVDGCAENSTENHSSQAVEGCAPHCP